MHFGHKDNLEEVLPEWFKLRSSRAESNWPLRATVGQNSSSVQMASAYNVGAAVSALLDSALDEGSFSNLPQHFEVT